MFTGLIHETGTVVAFEKSAAGARLELQWSPRDEPVVHGESVAVNGVCLTFLPEPDGRVSADLSPETLALTALEDLVPGEAVNLERALRLADRLGGHIVQGHVDAVGELISTETQGEFAVYRWTYPAQFAPLVVSKGSIAVDGISLTIVDPDERSFAVALIPETLEKTNLGRSRPGRRFNLEFDVTAKLVQRMLEPYLERIASR
ncbi:MAG: riboflavin synthase [Thermoanaerobaculia bacterium]